MESCSKVTMHYLASRVMIEMSIFCDAINFIIGDAANYTNVWFVDLGALTTTNRGEWFSDVKILEKLSYIETCDDIPHPIVHVDKVPLAM